MNRSWMCSCALLACGWATAAAANGGGASTTYLGGGVFTIAPLRDRAIRLVREDLDIALGEEGPPDRARLGDPASWVYRVHARYHLANPGPAKTVLYAVPIVLPIVPFNDGPDDIGASTSGAYASEHTKIRLDGTEHPCRYQTLPPDEARTEEWAVLGSGLAPNGLRLDGFCLAELEVRSGKDIALELEYAGDLFGMNHADAAPKECDAEFHCEEGESAKACARRRPAFERWQKEHCDPPTVHSGPWLYYPLGAASTWAGTPDAVSVTVHLGGFEVDSTSGLPDGASRKGSTLRWTWKRQNLEGLDFTLTLKVPGGKNERLSSFNTSEGDLRWCRPSKLSARASSSLKPQQGNAYGPEQAIDGKGSTAWCVNTARDGVGEWIEIAFDAGPSYSGSGGLFVLPGYAKSQASYEANAQVEAIRYGACGKGQPLVEAKLPPPSALFEAVVEVPDAAKTLGEIIEAAKGGKTCIHVEIASIRPGKKFKDVCIAEIVAPLRCQ